MWVRLSLVYRQTVFPPARFRTDERTLDFTSDAPGLLHRWYRARIGEWFGLVSFSVLYASGIPSTGLELDNQLIPAEALRPRTCGAERRR